jgi:hypothetical protein
MRILKKMSSIKKSSLFCGAMLFATPLLAAPSTARPAGDRTCECVAGGHGCTGLTSWCCQDGKCGCTIFVVGCDPEKQ